MTDSSFSFSRLLAELKRRRVIRVAVVYAIGAWAVLQGVATLGDLLDLPGWIGKLVVALLALGLPLALGLAWAFDVTPSGVQRTEPVGPPLLTRRSAWFVIGIFVALSVAFYTYTSRRPGGDLDANAVAVLPFRVTTADPSLHYLSEGMVDLLGAKLTGQGGPRALDPRAVISAIRRTGSEPDALDPENSLNVARELGAGLLLRGEIVGTPKNIVLSAVLIDARNGTEKTRQSVEGSPDSLSILVDRLAGQLLARGAGVPEDQIARFAYVPLAAVQNYLAGQAKYRHGEYNAALTLYRRALQIDSTFLAVLPSYVAALEWSSELTEEAPHIVQLAVGLNERDRALIAMFIPQVLYPQSRVGDFDDFARYSGEAADKALRLAPDNPEAHYVYGDVRFHFGLPNNPTRSFGPAIEGFEAALEIDSTFAPALGHMVEIAAFEGDTAAVRKYIRRYLAADSAGDLAGHIRWVAAHALGDSAAIRALRARFHLMSNENLWRILGTAQLAGIALEDADLVERELLKRPVKHWSPFLYAVSRGRDEFLAEVLERTPADWRPSQAILLALFANGDSIEAATAIETFRAISARPVPANGTREQRSRATYAPFITAMWDLLHGRPRDVTPIIKAVEEFSTRDARLLAALAAQVNRTPDAPQKLSALDTLVFQDGLYDPYTLLLAARMHEAKGDRAGALKIIRNRARHWGEVDMLPALLKDEGRLAAQLGDREGAVRAYTHYLKLRSNPSPRYVSERDWVRAELARLSPDR